MKRLLAIGVVLLPLVGCGQGASLAPTAPSTSAYPFVQSVRYAVSGTVRDEQALPLQGALVMFLQSKFNGGTVYTNELGEYRLSLPDGGYGVIISHRGFRGLSRNADIRGSTTLDFTLTRSQ